MAKQSPHTSWKGCPMCKPYKERKRGQADRKPVSELRFIGSKRRVSRHEIGDDAQ